MKLFLLTLILLTGFACTYSQRVENLTTPFTPNIVPDQTRASLPKNVFRTKADLLATTEVRSENEKDGASSDLKRAAFNYIDSKPERSAEELIKEFEKPEYVGELTKQSAKKGFDLKRAVGESLLFVAAQHGYRLTEEKTRQAFRGPFLHDWRESVSNLRGWSDGGKFFTNYIAHPAEGSVYAKIFINNSEKAKTAEFGRSKEYWMSRLKAFAWAAAWSTQFEIGPLGEAAIGNVGQRLNANGRSGLTYEDIVVTPILGFGLTVVEDAVDRYVLKNWIERRVRSRTAMKFFRTVLTPTTSFANLMRFRAPWWHEDKTNRQ